MIIYTLDINLETLEIDEDLIEVEEPYFDTDYMTEGDAIEDGHVTYNEDGWGNVCCEASSKKLARRKAFEYCLKMSDLFNFASKEIKKLSGREEDV